MQLTVGKIFKKYEQLYKKLNEKFTTDESFYILNNSIVFSFFARFIDTEYDKSNIEICKKEIEDRYGKKIFFSNIKKKDNYYESFKNCIDIFWDMFKTENINNRTLEKLLGNVLEKHINQKETGSYYTPDDTTKFISWNTILITILKNSSKEINEKILCCLNIKENMEILSIKYGVFDALKIIADSLTIEEKKEIINNIYRLKIIDPTCGSGAFIISAIEFLDVFVNTLDADEMDYLKILNCIYGLDISKEAIQLTKLRMLMYVAEKNIELKELRRIFEDNFIVADALVGSDYVINEIGFDWKNFKTKFDCIIGNPPYVEKKNYVSESFETRKCGNLYAYVIERACNIIKENGMISFIVPLPFVATQRMQPAKQFLEKCSNSVYYSTYADRPGCIFTGVHQRLTIFFADINLKKDQECKIYSSSYKYWYNEERAELYNKIKFYRNEYNGILPKIGNKLEDSIFKKLLKGKYSIQDFLVEESEFAVFLSTRIGFWSKAFITNIFTSNEYKKFCMENMENQYIITAILNSSAFYFLWVVYSDCWHITNNDINRIRFDFNDEIVNKDKVVKLVKKLMEDLEKNKIYIGSKQTEYEYKHKFSKKIIDEIDDEISKMLGLNDKELEYVKRFTEKYRLNTLEV